MVPSFYTKSERKKTKTSWKKKRKLSIAVDNEYFAVRYMYLPNPSAYKEDVTQGQFLSGE